MMRLMSIILITFCFFSISAAEDYLWERHIPVDAPDGISWLENTSDGIAIRVQNHGDETQPALEVMGSARFYGTVGIGTTPTVYPFHIEKEGHPAGTSTFHTLAKIRGLETFGGVYLGYNTRENYAGAIASVSNSLSFWTTSDIPEEWEERMTITTDGNIGIGTTSPERPLHIYPKIGAPGIQMTHPDGGMEWEILTDAAHDRFEIGTTDDAKRLVILSNNGNVGIGTTDPTEKLEVEGNVKAHSFITDGLCVFQENGSLYLENLTTGQVSKIFLESDVEALKQELKREIISELRSGR